MNKLLDKTTGFPNIHNINYFFNILTINVFVWKYVF